MQSEESHERSTHDMTGAHRESDTRDRQLRRQKQFIEALKSREDKLPPGYRYQFEQRLRGLRQGLAVRKSRLKGSLQALEDFDKALTEAFDKGMEQGPATPFSTEDLPEDDQSFQRGALYDIFDAILLADDEAQWTKTDQGLRVPRAEVVNAELSKRGLAAMTQAEIDKVYIAYVNGE